MSHSFLFHVTAPRIAAAQRWLRISHRSTLSTRKLVSGDSTREKMVREELVIFGAKELAQTLQNPFAKLWLKLKLFTPNHAAWAEMRSYQMFLKSRNVWKVAGAVTGRFAKAQPTETSQRFDPSTFRHYIGGSLPGKSMAFPRKLLIIPTKPMEIYFFTGNAEFIKPEHRNRRFTIYTGE